MEAVGSEQAGAIGKLERQMFAVRLAHGPGRESLVKPSRPCTQMSAEWLREGGEGVDWRQAGNEDASDREALSQEEGDFGHVIEPAIDRLGSHGVVPAERQYGDVEDTARIGRTTGEVSRRPAGRGTRACDDQPAHTEGRGEVLDQPAA
jgi:hypothetical protein